MKPLKIFSFLILSIICLSAWSDYVDAKPVDAQDDRGWTPEADTLTNDTLSSSDTLRTYDLKGLYEEVYLAISNLNASDTSEIAIYHITTRGDTVQLSAFDTETNTLSTVLKPGTAAKRKEYKINHSYLKKLYVVELHADFVKGKRTRIVPRAVTRGR